MRFDIPPANKAGAIYPMNPEKLKTRQEVARELNVSLRTIDNLIAGRAIEVIRINGAVRFSPAAVEKFKQSRTVTAAA